MTVVFPRPMPSSGVAQQGFRIARVDYAAPETSGAIGGVTAGWPRWSGAWTLGTMCKPANDEWEAWVDSFDGQQRIFLGRDFRRPYPLAHTSGFARMQKVGGAAFAGAGASWSQAIDAQGVARLTVTGLPSGLILSRIDYVGFKWDAAGSAAGSFDRRALVRVIERAVADATGSITVAVKPAVPGIVPTGAIPHLDYPSCLMKLTGDTQIVDIDNSLRIKGSKIVGAQVLLP